MPLTPERLQDAYRQMLVIRKFEETIRDLYQQGKIRGSFHPCVGQEATAIGGCWAIRKEDYMTCTYRGHGQAIAKGLSVRAAMAEMLGKVTGCSQGKGGSMHFTDPSVGLLGANAIVGAGVPHAAGAALAAQLQKKDNVALAYFGEGAVNQGVFLETLNLAAVWKLPLILVCENNRYSEMTPSHETTSNVETYKRASAFGLESIQIDGNDIEAVYSTVEEAAAKARAGGGPTYIEAMTYRLWGHMLGDPEIYRTKEEVVRARENEPIVRLGRRLIELGCQESDLAQFDSDAESVITDAVEFAKSSPVPEPADAFTDVFI
ncbi:MAG: thiamine pyrophosphate-dependent dehydrogenase E1 component subunit alpha [Chloroflexi bacterium]|nr:MAG: thiamine pyrophosphate-dependent dehydrogenase E1 component subunit alpha [Chloroflexota bacterium]